MKTGEKFGTVGGAGKGKAAAEEKGKRTSHHTRIELNFDLKTSKLHSQEDVDKYLASYGFILNPGIKIEFCPHMVDVSLAPPNSGVNMHPLVLTLVLRLLMTSFVCSILAFYQVTASQFLAVAYDTRVGSPLQFCTPLIGD